MGINKKILDYCMEKWNKRFDGISAYSVSEKLGISHKKVREVFKLFRRENKGSLNENIILRPFNLSKRDKANSEIITTVFYPSKESLAENYIRSDLSNKNIPEFRKRLHLGHQRNELAYFSKSVLHKYSSLPDKFTIQDSPIGGFLSSNPAYIKSLPKENMSEEYIPILRFGKRKVDKTEYIITAILEDLAELPESEQEHWHFSEVERPNFSLFDPDFHKYHLRYYTGNPVRTRDPLNKLVKILKKINSLPNVGPLFDNLNISTLGYPVKKTQDDFCTSCDELYRLIGPENLNTEILKKFLHSNYNYSHLDFQDPKNQPLRNEDLFEKFLQQVGFEENSIGTLLNELKKHEVPSDHHMEISYLNSRDFLTEFKKMCQSLLICYTILYEKLKNGVTAPETIQQ